MVLEELHREKLPDVPNTLFFNLFNLCRETFELIVVFTEKHLSRENHLTPLNEKRLFDKLSVQKAATKVWTK